MKLNGTHKFKAARQHVFNGILNPTVLQQSIPGCESIDYIDANRLRANITTSLPGFKGPYGIIISIAQRQEPSLVVLQVQRQGRGGSVNANCQINIVEEADGALLSYDANAELGGPIAFANNPIGQGVVKSTLNNVFNNLDKAIS